ncbi:unnamed protein product [Dracunculus medinensis]|uniref:Uncharacterized protein n=1 Tax=Dracunculus medinensis TaxID=318479 RepID=A0A0N4ULV9_DRAME|nr:unnamed protein product [Dracunculus medinensis]
MENSSTGEFSITVERNPLFNLMWSQNFAALATAASPTNTIVQPFLSQSSAAFHQSFLQSLVHSAATPFPQQSSSSTNNFCIISNNSRSSSEQENERYNNNSSPSRYNGLKRRRVSTPNQPSVPVSPNFVATNSVVKLNSSVAGWKLH